MGGTDVDRAVQALVSGLAVGGAYALIALGFSITFTTTKTLNFSHGDFVSAGAFIGVTHPVAAARQADQCATDRRRRIAGWQQLVAALGSVIVIGLSRLASSMCWPCGHSPASRAWPG